MTRAIQMLNIRERMRRVLGVPINYAVFNLVL
jgi:hypothetical protein